ncbi:MAG: tRNA uridine-5-carboxymethylaminomethyl(34) synthesis GTPase MnmE [Bacteroidales bacterium]|nr:tRNA uridine-5-carboxymethylaminomethyl(34) synthesis GTPase MnmE [Bacteroidales bacterium]
MFESTICAPATSGSGAIGIIRLSGPDAFSIADKIFSSANGMKIREMKANTIHFGEIIEKDEIVDEVLVSIFKNPHSYTGEDSVEISCHASPFIRKRILELLVDKGASIARPGEFTQRAFLNGKMDLAQAEAVADLIAAESKASHRIALNQMRGGFSRELSGLRKELLQFTSMIELELDFSEEDVEFANREALEKLVSNMLSLIESLTRSFKNGNVIKNGVPVAIIGKPNVGKSSLLNRLLNEEKAIVSEIAGTTRDSIEDTIRIGDISFRFIDTAGIRETADIIENLGIRKTYQKIDQASIILLLADARDDAGVIAESFHEIRKQIAGQDKHLILVLNKADLTKTSRIPELNKLIITGKNEYLLEFSALKAENTDELHKVLIQASELGNLDRDAVVISNIRHYEALEQAAENLNRIRDGIKSALPSDLLTQDLRQAIHYLGEITGEITTEEVLGNIFKNFCIGK